MDKNDWIKLSLMTFVVLGFIVWSSYSSIQRTNTFKNACITCGYNEVTDRRKVNAFSCPNYHIIECDNGPQITVFDKISVINKWNKSKRISKIMVNCGDYRTHQNIPDKHLPIVEWPNDCSDSDSHNCYVEGYVGVYKILGGDINEMDG